MLYNTVNKLCGVCLHCKLNHSCVHSCSQSLMHSLMHSITHAFTHALNHSSIHALIHALNHSCTQSLIHSCTHSCTHALNHTIGDALWRPERQKLSRLLLGCAGSRVQQALEAVCEQSGSAVHPFPRSATAVRAISSF